MLGKNQNYPSNTKIKNLKSTLMQLVKVLFQDYVTDTRIQFGGFNKKIKKKVETVVMNFQ
jgi:hypothetical protein